MRKITIWLMKYNLKKTIKKQALVDNTIVKSAYSNMIRNYKDTIMYLEAQNTGEAKSMN
jgi:hypothetical protein